MISDSTNRISYNGNGIATEFAYPFKILDKSDVNVMLVDPDGVTNIITKNYYVDAEKSVVFYPGYAPGAEIPESERPPVLPAGWRLVLYRTVPVTQLANLLSQWPFNVIEDAFDKLTIICQQLKDGLSRALKVDESQSQDLDTTIPWIPGKSFRVNDEGTGLTEMGNADVVIEEAQEILEENRELTATGTAARDEAVKAAASAKDSSDAAAETLIKVQANYLKRNTKYAVGDIAYSDLVPAGYYLEFAQAGITGEVAPIPMLEAPTQDGTAIYEAKKIGSGNKITKVSELENDTGFVTKKDVPSKISDLKNDDFTVKDKSYVHTDNNYTDNDKGLVADIFNFKETSRVDFKASSDLWTSSNTLTLDIGSEKFFIALYRTNGNVATLDLTTTCKQENTTVIITADAPFDGYLLVTGATSYGNLSEMLGIILNEEAPSVYTLEEILGENYSAPAYPNQEQLTAAVAALENCSLTLRTEGGNILAQCNAVLAECKNYYDAIKKVGEGQ